MNCNFIFKNSVNNLWMRLFRNYSTKLPEGIPYHGFTYYPRREGFKDPPYKPSKLFLIKRIKSMKGRNPEERDCLKRLNIDGQAFFKQHISIVKNIPQINALLWKIKHLIEIRPVVWSGDLPEDCSGTYLRETGELMISPKLKISDEEMKISNDYENSPLRMKKIYIKHLLIKRWNKGHYNI